MNPNSSGTAYESPTGGKHVGEDIHHRGHEKGPNPLRYTLPALILAIFAGLAYWRVEMRTRVQAQLLPVATSAQTTPVAVVHPQKSNPNQSLTLPGNVQAFVETPIYARTAGYLKKWYVDIGGKVQAGDMLAQIDTPEVDQQLRQAEAAQLQSEANLELAKTTAERWQNLLKSDGVSQQEVDQNLAALKARQADYQSAVANVDRLKDLQSFQKVTAPFSGVITARSVDIGALISAGNAQQLFKLAQINVLRVYINVPETESGSMVPGLAAEVHVAEFPNRVFRGSVARTSGAIDTGSRTLLTEVDVPNPKGELMPGAYAQVEFNIKTGGTSLVVPSNTLIFRSAGSQVAVVENNYVHLRNVTIGRDFGTSLEIVTGLNENDAVIVNPPDSLSDGELVSVSYSQPAAPPAQPSK